MNNVELLTIQDVQRLLRISRSKAYSLTKQEDFPIIKIGKSIRVLKIELLNWLQNTRDML